MEKKPNIIVRIMGGCWSLLNNTRKIVLNILFFGFIIILMVSAKSDGNVVVPQGSALNLNIEGALVEQKKQLSPIDQITQDAYGKGPDAETLDGDVVHAIALAKDDDPITMLVINSSAMTWGSLAKLQTIGKAITDFKESNKPVYAVGGSYNQSQYYLASHADKIFMNSKGIVSIDGFSRYRLYHKDLLDKLKINTHIFRVGTYKSALEPYLRNDMSDAAKVANKSWLGDLWSSYVNDVSAQRSLTSDQFDISLEDYLVAVKAAHGNLSQTALDLGLVDVLDTRINITKTLVDMVGESKNKLSFNKISMQDYLAAATYKVAPKANIAVIVASGTILNGHQPAGTIGGLSTSLLLRKARLNDNIKAVVLRIDSGGGSAYASEQIRNEVLALQAAGKPVVASMGSVAASGGYWIAANADKIIAQETTITGSIGIFGMINTFEDSLESIGVYTDGVSTKKLAGITVTRDLPEGFKELMQSHIEHGYRQFLGLVSNARGMTMQEVDQIAQGRVWSGQKAFELGLVDQIGDFQSAIDSAVKLAGLEAGYIKVFEKKLTPMQEFMRNLMNSSVEALGLEPSPLSPIGKIMAQLNGSLSTLSQFDDPQNAYLYCMQCQP
ncbi:MAG: signal peptide peptidase SppA [Psychrobium sp.]|nr:signal peptide peptidase SppA [Psychrobium sp.]